VLRSSSGCDGFAHDSAKVGDQVRLLARILRNVSARPERSGVRTAPVICRPPTPALVRLHKLSDHPNSFCCNTCGWHVLRFPSCLHALATQMLATKKFETCVVRRG